jgi:hypothetical protein
VPLSAYAAQRPVLVWPENRSSVSLFIAMRHEWRVGMSGPTGLDKTCIDRFQRLVGIKRRDRLRTFRDLLVLEDAALEAMQPPPKD